MENQTGANQRIPDQSSVNLLALWIFALAWNLASLIGVVPLLRNAVRAHDLVKETMVLFPAIGLLLLLRAAFRTARIVKFGESVLHLKPPLPSPGGDLLGTIHMTRPVPSRRPVEVRLLCINRIMSSSRRGGISEIVRWRDQQRLDQLSPSGQCVDIPVSFHVPSDATPTDMSNLRNQILWRLEARYRAGLVPYLSRYDVPLRATPEIQLTPAAAPHSASSSPPPHQFIESGVEHQTIAGGGLKIHFAAGRNKRGARVPAIAGLLLTGIAIGLLLAPIGMPMKVIAIAFAAVVGFIGLVFDYIALYHCLVSQEITVYRDSIALELRALLFRRQWTYPASDITEVSCEKDGQATFSDNQGNTADRCSYGIKIKMRDEKSVWIGNNILDPGYAEWLAAEIRSKLGLLEKSGG